MQKHLFSISPIDGRYFEKTQDLQQYFSEYAIIKYRIMVEVKYFLELTKLDIKILNGITNAEKEKIVSIINDFNEKDAFSIKKIENKTNHDVKAVEYFLKEKFDELKMQKYKEFIHFGLTSQDINNTAFHIALKNFLEEIFIPSIKKTIDQIDEKAIEYKDIPILSHTHGQPASPSKLGKELKVFSYRLQEQFNILQKIQVSGKFAGAVGNFNAHYVAFPNINWKKFADKFLLNEFSINREQYTTQISNYDNLANIFDTVKRINTILLDFCKDIWQYISMEYFKQKIKKEEVGSSAMPHKVNPIDFENAEGNLGMANAFFEYLSAKLPISRLQRDLTDSTVLRNIGVPFAYTIIAVKSIEKGISKLLINKEKINFDLEKNWIIVAEAIQTILRRENYPNPYESLKELTRTNNNITKENIISFIMSLNIEEAVKNELLQITPQNYTGK